MTRARHDELLLGEWACLGVLAAAPSHGFAVARRLAPDGDVGRVWSLSRPLTYRAVEQLTARGLIRPVAEEPGIAGGTRTILAPTRAGRSQLRRWLLTPIAHVRDLRSELLLKVVLADLCGVDVHPMLERQRAQVAELADALAVPPPTPGGRADVVALWRAESSQAALRFLDRLLASPTPVRGAGARASRRRGARAPSPPTAAGAPPATGRPPRAPATG